MVFHLVIDAMRRKWTRGAFSVFQLYIFFNMLGKIWPSTEGVGWTMSGSVFLAVLVGDHYQARELYQLPVSRRQWWLARWWLCMTAPVVLAQLAVIWSEWSERSTLLTVEQHILFVTFGLLYSGCGLFVQSTGFGQAGEQPFTLGSAGWAFVTILAMTAAPLTLGHILPHSFADLNAPWIAVMAVMAAFTVAGYRFTPALEARPSRVPVRKLPAGVPAVPQSFSLKPRKWSDRLTGTTLVLWDESRKHFLIFTFMIVAGITAWVIGSQIKQLPPLAKVLRMAGALPFSDARREIAEEIVYGAVLAFAGFADGWSTRLRSLRALPLSSTRLAALPAMLGLISAAMLALALLILHLLMLRTMPVTARLDLFVTFAGFMALANAIRIAGPGGVTVRGMLAWAPVGAIWLAFGFAETRQQMNTIQDALALAGPALLIVSWAFMRHAIGHGSRIYRPQPNPAIPGSA